MAPAPEASVGELVELLLSDALIDACHMTAEVVTIVQGTRRHSFPYDQAHAFLAGMVGGRSWTVRSGQWLPGGGIEPALDELLELARAFEIIERFEKDCSSGSVTIVLPVCEVTMPFDEAADFLRDCVLHRFHATRQESGEAEQEKARTSERVDVGPLGRTITSGEDAPYLDEVAARQNASRQATFNGSGWSDELLWRKLGDGY